jgi:hypothetical protein
MIPPYAKIFEFNPHDEGTKLASMLRTHTAYHTLRDKATLSGM